MSATIISSGDFPSVGLRDKASSVAQILDRRPKLPDAGIEDYSASDPDTLVCTIPARGGQMDILAQLKAARDKAAFELGRLEAAISALSGRASGSIKSTRTRRKMSAAARRKISLAQRARWAKRNNGQASLRPKRHVSATSRRKMAAAQRARWARFNQRKAA